MFQTFDHQKATTAALQKKKLSLKSKKDLDPFEMIDEEVEDD